MQYISFYMCGRCTQLLGELEAAQVSSSQSQGQLQAALQDHQGRHLLWETEKAQLQVNSCWYCLYHASKKKEWHPKDA